MWAGGVERTRSLHASGGRPAPGWSPAVAGQRTRAAWSVRPLPPTSAAARRRALSARPREDELLYRRVFGPDSHRLLAEDLDHRRDRVGVVAHLVEGDRAAVLHEPSGVVRLFHRIDDRVGVVERG